MAGFEVIVRPVVFPNIRPSPTRSLPPADDATQGMAVLGGGSGQVIALIHSYSASGSSQSGRETERTFDEARVYQQKEDGSVNRDTYVDVEVMKHVGMRNYGGDTWELFYSPVEIKPNVEILRSDVKRTAK